MLICRPAVKKPLLLRQSFHALNREVESEGSRMATLWSDEQKSHEVILRISESKHPKNFIHHFVVILCNLPS